MLVSCSICAALHAMYVQVAPASIPSLTRTLPQRPPMENLDRSSGTLFLSSVRKGCSGGQLLPLSLTCHICRLCWELPLWIYQCQSTSGFLYHDRKPSLEMVSYSFAPWPCNLHDSKCPVHHSAMLSMWQWSSEHLMTVHPSCFFSHYILPFLWVFLLFQLQLCSVLPLIPVSLISILPCLTASSSTCLLLVSLLPPIPSPSHFPPWFGLEMTIWSRWQMVISNVSFWLARLIFKIKIMKNIAKKKKKQSRAGWK